MQIEKATINDAEIILEIQKKAFYSEGELHNNFHIEPLVQTLESFKEEFQLFHYYKAVIDGVIAGSVRVNMSDNGNLHIGRVIVRPEYQNKGIGRKIMQFIEEKYADVQAFELFTAEKSERNIHFYLSMGYVIESKFHEPGHADVVLVKLIKEIN